MWPLPFWLPSATAVLQPGLLSTLPDPGSVLVTVEPGSTHTGNNIEYTLQVRGGPVAATRAVSSKSAKCVSA